MLTRRPSGAQTLTDAKWIDLVQPSDAERAEVEAATGLSLPTRAAIEEIESSSRVQARDGVLYLSTPLLTGDDCLAYGSTTVGLVLTPERLVTLRYAAIAAFDGVLAHFDERAERSSSDGFLLLLEAIVDHAADALERVGAVLEGVSRAAFRADRAESRRPAHASEALRNALRQLGQLSDGTSHLRDSLLGVGRIAVFVHETARETHLAGTAARLAAIREDIVSLNDYQAHLAGKIQFLLDATLGFISIQQNEIVKTLTIVSLVGIPPVLVVGVYGMNFHVMPELAWPLGYPFALGLMVVSALVPLGWLKWRGWM